MLLILFIIFVKYFNHPENIISILLKYPENSMEIVIRCQRFNEWQEYQIWQGLEFN